MYEAENLDYGEGQIEGAADSDNQDGMELEMRIQNEQDGRDGADEMDSDVK